MTTAFDHDSLLTLARKAHAAAGDADLVRLADDLDALVHALVHHLDRELPLLSRVPPADARLVRRGQARIAAVARTLLQDARAGCTGQRRGCTARVEELLALLTLQARDERITMHAGGLRSSNWRWQR